MFSKQSTKKGLPGNKEKFQTITTLPQSNSTGSNSWSRPQQNPSRKPIIPTPPAMIMGHAAISSEEAQLRKKKLDLSGRQKRPKQHVQSRGNNKSTFIEFSAPKYQSTHNLTGVGEQIER